MKFDANASTYGPWGNFMNDAHEVEGNDDGANDEH